MTCADGKQEFRNRVLYDLLTTGPVVDFEWSSHAKDRVRELTVQGLDVMQLAGVVGERRKIVWSKQYCAPIVICGEFSIPLIVSEDARVIAVTALPSSRAAWEKVYSTGLVSAGRERRF